MVCATSNASDQPAHMRSLIYAQSDHRLCLSLEYSMTVQLLTEHPAERHLEFLSLKGGCTGSSESTLVEMRHCWKADVMAHILGEHPCTILPVLCIL